MILEVVLPALLGLALAAVRSAAWLLVSPPFATRAVPAPAKAVLAVALALPVAPGMTAALPQLSTGALLTAVALQALTGAALGFVTLLLFAAVQAAGDLVDLFGGFSLSFGFDPLSMTQTSVFGRLHQLFALTLLFTTDAHLMVVRGFLASYEAVPLGSSVALDRLGPALIVGLSEFFLSALQIAGPLIGVLVLADVGLGLLTRVSPQLNAFSLGFPLKIAVTVLLVTSTFAVLPQAVVSAVDTATRAVLGVSGG